MSNELLVQDRVENEFSINWILTNPNHNPFFNIFDLYPHIRKIISPKIRIPLEKQSQIIERLGFSNEFMEHMLRFITLIPMAERFCHMERAKGFVDSKIAQRNYGRTKIEFGIDIKDKFGKKTLEKKISIYRLVMNESIIPYIESLEDNIDNSSSIFDRIYTFGELKRRTLIFLKELNKEEGNIKDFDSYINNWAKDLIGEFKLDIITDLGETDILCSECNTPTHKLEIGSFKRRIYFCPKCECEIVK